MSVDYRPYLLETDLRTAEDARNFVASFGNSAFTGDVLRVLDERLNRERRQACRRGALEEWRAFRKALPRRGSGEPSRRIIEALVWIPHWPSARAFKEQSEFGEIRESLLGKLARALSFRAAARGK